MHRFVIRPFVTPSCRIIKSSTKKFTFHYRPFSTIYRNMSGLSVELTAPNGIKYTQPTGLFINNEWVKSSKGNTIASISPS